MKPAGKTADVLRHEQLHFDITEIKAQQLTEAIRSFSFTSEHFKEELNALHKQYQKEMEDMQQQYDLETQHSLIKKAAGALGNKDQKGASDLPGR